MFWRTVQRRIRSAASDPRRAWRDAAHPRLATPSVTCALGHLAQSLPCPFAYTYESYHYCSTGTVSLLYLLCRTVVSTVPYCCIYCAVLYMYCHSDIASPIHCGPALT